VTGNSLTVFITPKNRFIPPEAIFQGQNIPKSTFDRSPTPHLAGGAYDAPPGP